MLGLALGGQRSDERGAFEAASQGAPMARRANRHMVVVAPEADLVARLDPEFVTQLLGDDDLTLGSDTMSHTGKYNSSRMGQAQACTAGSDPPSRGGVGSAPR